MRTFQEIALPREYSEGIRHLADNSLSAHLIPYAPYTPYTITKIPFEALHRIQPNILDVTQH